MEMGQEKLDEYFYDYYFANDKSYLNQTVEYLMDLIKPERRGLLEDCIDSFKNEKHRITIPSLLILIEGEAADILETEDIGYKLKNKMSMVARDEKEQIDQIATYTTYHFLREELYDGHNFSKKRLDMINRNWILHGRGNPELWSKHDSLRLINVLSSLQLIKQYKDMYSLI